MKFFTRLARMALMVATAVLLSGLLVTPLSAQTASSTLGQPTTTRTQALTLEPLYRLYLNDGVDHFYTASWSDVLVAVSHGYVYEGITGYCWS